MKRISTFFILLLSSCGLFAQTIWHVNSASQAPFPTGSSWDLALPNLQTALILAHPGDEIWVAQGVYKPTEGNDRTAYFTMTDGVELYGGFSGVETAREQRNWDTNQTILSGDIGVAGDSTDNSYTVLYAFFTNDKTRLDGFVVEKGNANDDDPNLDGDSPTKSGGGIYVNGYSAFVFAQLGIYNCTFRHNHARTQGGAIYANGKDGGFANVRLDHCLFEQNTADSYGGGLALANTSPQPIPLEISNCTFRGNRSELAGGAVWLQHQQAILMDHCLFQQNITSSGNVFIGGKSTAYPIVFNRCDFLENDGLLPGFGSGKVSCIFFLFDFPPSNGRSIAINACKFWKNKGLLVRTTGSIQDVYKVSFEQSIFYENIAEAFTNGIYTQSSTPYKTDFANCVFYNNKGHEILTGSPPPVLSNCILVDNVDAPNDWVFSNNFVLKNCIVNHATCGALTQFGMSAVCENVQYTTNPLFVAPSAGLNADFHLQPCSPAINAGYDPILDSLSIITDFDGNPRIRNGRVDIGPYESNVAAEVHTIPPSCAGDSNGKITLSGNLCAPYSLVWNNGLTTGSNLNGLAAGTYFLTIIDAHNVIIHDTVVVPEQTPLALDADVHNSTCPGQIDGYVVLSTHGGVPFPNAPHYVFSPLNPPTVPLGAGAYSYTVTDANGCSAAASVTIEAPPPFEFLYTEQNASGPNTPDGAILFDSIIGGWGGASPPADLHGLLPGTYGFTITDNYGCTAITSIAVGFTSETNEPTGEFACRLYPNPGFSDEPVFIETNENEGFRVVVFDWCGRRMYKTDVNHGRTALHSNGLPAGVYRVEMVGESGRRAVRRWVVMNH